VAVPVWYLGLRRSIRQAQWFSVMTTFTFVHILLSKSTPQRCLMVRASFSRAEQLSCQSLAVLQEVINILAAADTSPCACMHGFKLVWY
jgi:hypothetical protein